MSQPCDPTLPSTVTTKTVPLLAPPPPGSWAAMTMMLGGGFTKNAKDGVLGAGVPVLEAKLAQLTGVNAKLSGKDATKREKKVFLKSMAAARKFAEESCLGNAKTAETWESDQDNSSLVGGNNMQDRLNKYTSILKDGCDSSDDSNNDDDDHDHDNHDDHGDGSHIHTCDDGNVAVSNTEIYNTHAVETTTLKETNDDDDWDDWDDVGDDEDGYDDDDDDDDDDNDGAKNNDGDDGDDDQRDTTAYSTLVGNQHSSSDAEYENNDDDTKSENNDDDTKSENNDDDTKSENNDTISST